MALKFPNIQYSDKSGSKKTPQILAVAIAVVAAGVSIWGVNSNGLTAGMPSTRASQAPPETVAAPNDKEEADRLLKVGALLHQERCAGCHSVNSKLIGPSYSAICRKYGESVDIPGNPAPGVNDQIDTAVLSAISFAATHPKSVWDGYEQGPVMTLTPEERRAVAFWIFNNSKNKVETDE